MEQTYTPVIKKHRASQKGTRKAANIAIYITLTIISLVWIIPFVFILIESFRTNPTSQVSNPFYSVNDNITYTWGFDNYINLFTDTTGGLDFKQWYLNTFIASLAVAVIQTIFVLSVAYTLSRFRFKLRKPLMNLMLILGMFPGFLTMIILYKLLADWGLIKETATVGLILVYVASSGMGYYVSKGFFDTIPKSLDEAARIDGCNRAQVFFKVILPLAKPIVIYTILTAFMGPWGDFIFASYVANGAPDGYNVAVGLYQFLDKAQINARYTQFCAGGVLVAIPVTILFMCLQKYYVEGVTGGAVKG